MCGIAGFYDPEKSYLAAREHYTAILEKMNAVQHHRGPDDSGVLLEDHVGLAHTRLAIIDPDKGRQPMSRIMDGRKWTIIYNGELYNTAELRADLLARGWTFETTSDTEVILVGVMEYGVAFVKQLNGIFAFAVYDPVGDRVLLFRDRCGVKPLFYALRDGELIFSSEIKGLFAFPGVTPRLDQRGLNEIFSIGPAKTYGVGVFRGVEELLPGHLLIASPGGISVECYWKLESRVHEDSFETTVETTRALVLDAIRRQMVSDVPICTFLSGGVDSSLVTAVCGEELKKRGEQLRTFSFDFTGNDRNFQPSAFQPSQDRPYVDLIVDYLKTDHRYLECGTEDQFTCLEASVDARDLPAMADVDSSLIYFCKEVSRYNKVVLTGECADEIFGGYPWFHKKECFDAHTFPWTMDLEARKALLRDDFLDYLGMDAYVAQTYERSVAETPRLAQDTPEEARRREIAYLNIKWFMQTLLDRMDRTSMFSGLEARVPYADHRVLEYVWNVPWAMKTKDGVVKALLRACGVGRLPDEVLYRRKSPYPKTYDKRYEALLSERLLDIMSDTGSPVRQFLDPKKLEAFLASPSDYGKPWYGQLMAGPQMLAYMIQVNYWMKKWNIALIS